MSIERLEPVLARHLQSLDDQGIRKGEETVTVEVIPASGEHGPRYRLAGHDERPFLRMNSNGYLGLALAEELAAAAEDAVRRFGTGPQAVRFISGTCAPHRALEEALARFHQRPAAMAFSSAYAAMIGVLPALVSEETVVVSDALNHNCIINATRLARPARRAVYPHLDLGELEARLAAAVGTCRRALVVTDGVFSMRGDHAPLDAVGEIVARLDPEFPEGALLLVDDSHGVGASGTTGRGTEEVCGARADVLVATLGKALGVNGGYVVGSETLIGYLRETSPFYVYSNPITPGEAAAAGAALALLDGPAGRARLRHLDRMTRRFRDGLRTLGFETVEGTHPVVPLLVRDTARVRALAAHLRAGGILATGLGYPVVPRGEEEIRFQISAEHTAADIDQALAVLARFEG